MQLHNLKKNRSNRKSKQVGRGGTRGKTAGRGTKGQNARSGRKKRPEMRDMIKKIPKLRGRGRNFLKSVKKGRTSIKTSILEKNFSEGEVINKDSLVARGLLSESVFQQNVKIVLDSKSSGKIGKKFTVQGISLTAGAKSAIESVGGKIS